MFNSLFIQVFIEGIAGKILKQSCEMILAEACQICSIVERHVLGALFLYVLEYINELCSIFFSLDVGDFSFDSFAGVFSSDQYEHFQYT